MSLLRKKRPVFLFLLSLCVQALLSCPSFASCSREISVAVETPVAETPEQAKLPSYQTTRALQTYFEEIQRISHCHFIWQIAPRARSLHNFTHGQVDIIYAVQTEERDKYGEFSLLFKFRPSLILFDAKTDNPDVPSLINDKQRRFNLVRGFDYGPEYRKIRAMLEQQNRLEEVPDILTIVRKMQAGRVDATIMSPTIFYEPALTLQILPQIQVISLSDWSSLNSGIYLSRSSLSIDDKRVLQIALKQLADTGKFKDLLSKIYPAAITRDYFVK